MDGRTGFNPLHLSFYAFVYIQKGTIFRVRGFYLTLYVYMCAPMCLHCRLDEAIHLLESILDVKEEKLGTVHPEVDNERCRLLQHLKEVGRDRVRKTNTLEELLLLTNKNIHRKP